MAITRGTEHCGAAKDCHRLRASLLAAADNYVDGHGIWPLGESATDWLADPSAVAPQVSTHLEGQHVGYTLRFGDTYELLTENVDVAAQQLAALAAPATVWARGRTCPVRVAALASGWQVQRRLLLLHRDLPDRLPTPELPPRYRVRQYLPADADGWLAVNRAAFVDLPDQGSWGPSELAARLQAPWFDPGALLVLESPTGLAGSVWAKVTGNPADAAHEGGEIYVVAVHPDHQGQGLGRALVLAGLAVIHRAGHSRAHLYVDSSNVAARRLYRALGFTEHEEVVALRPPAPS